MSKDQLFFLIKANVMLGFIGDSNSKFAESVDDCKSAFGHAFTIGISENVYGVQANNVQGVWDGDAELVCFFVLNWWSS